MRQRYSTLHCGPRTPARHRRKRNGSARSAAIQTNGWSAGGGVRAKCGRAREYAGRRGRMSCVCEVELYDRPNRSPIAIRLASDASLSPFLSSWAHLFFVSENVASAHEDRSRRYAQPHPARDLRARPRLHAFDSCFDFASLAATQASRTLRASRSFAFPKASDVELSL
jgi:hypothetical protein